MTGTLFQSKLAKGFKSAPRGLSAGADMVSRGLLKFTAAYATATDKAELCILPPFCRVVDIIALAEVAVTDITFTVGFLTGEAGATDNARVQDAVFFAATTGEGVVTRMSLLTGFKQASVDYARGIGVTFDTDIPADATGATRIELLVLYTPDY